MAQTMAEYLIEQGEKQGEKIGEKKGETRAKRENLLTLLHIRFEPVPESVINKISSMRSISRLDSLFKKALTVKTLDEINW